MCGIVGIFSEEKLDNDSFSRMRRSLHHRGPDDSGVFVRDCVSMANLRLSIIDVEGGHQPFVSDDGLVAVVQNGEIYNHVELAAELKGTEYECRTRSDTEVLLRLYLRDGIDFLRRLNGMFAIAIYDGRTAELYLARDRIGVKPLFWYKDHKSTIFGSEIKAILAAGIERQADFSALSQYLALNYIPPPSTAFRNVYHVMPGTFLRISRENIQERVWWRLRDALVPDDSAGKCRDKDEFSRLFSDSVQLRMRSDVPFGAFLSGGVDSSAVVATMALYSDDAPKSFCIGFDDSRFDESAYAEQLARRVGADHTTSIVKQNMLELWPAVTFFNDQPHGDVSFMPTYCVAELAARDVKVVLTGDGGDELFAGYDKYRDFFLSNPEAFNSKRSIVDKYSGSLRLFSADLQQRLYSGDLIDHLEYSVSGAVADLLRNVDSNDGVNLALYIDCFWLLPGNNLVKPDRMGMAHSLEARTPFLDYRLVEWAFRLAGREKLAGPETKIALKKAVEGLIGQDLAYRKKQMFTVPIGEWLRERASALARDVLFDSRTVERGLFNTQEVRKLAEDHIAGRRNYTRELRALIALEIWFRVYIDQSALTRPTWDSIGFSNALAA